MSAAVRPLNFVDHGNVKIKPSRHFPHVAKEQIVPLVVHEFANASGEMPVVFVKNSDNGEFTPVAVLGFEQGENVFFGDTWRGSYVPAVITHRPFALMPTPEDASQMQLMVQQTDELMANSEGEALFTEDGSETPYLEKRKNALGKYLEHTHITKAFVDFLAEHELLVEQTLNLEFDGQKRQLSGVYLVSEAKLNELSDEVFLNMRKRGYLSAVYAHLMSMQQLNNLARLKSSK